MLAPWDVVESACVRIGSAATATAFSSMPITAMLAHVAFQICFLLILTNPLHDTGARRAK
jgi:hypothetical protein